LVVLLTISSTCLPGHAQERADTPSVTPQQSKDKTQAADLFRAAFEDLRSRDFNSARARFEAGLKLNDRDVNAWLYYRETLIGQSIQLSRSNRGEEIENAGRRIRELKPTDEQLTAVIASFYRIWDRTSPPVDIRSTDFLGRVCGSIVPQDLVEF